MIDTYKVYSEIELTTDVMTASSHRLITLLFNKCMQKMEAAKIFITEKNIGKKGEAIQGALDIIQYLRNCLNHESVKSKELATLLDSIYSYAQRNLLEANMNNDVSYIDEAKKVISEIQSGWNGISDNE